MKRLSLQSLVLLVFATVLTASLAYGIVAIAADAKAAAETGVRHVNYEAESVVSIRTKLRFTTLIVLPEHEEIMDWVCGDRDNWVISGEKNVTYIKPAQAGALSDLHLVTTEGHIYSFLVSEIGTTKPEQPDLRVIVNPGLSFPAPVAARRYYSTDQMEACHQDLNHAQEALKQSEAKATEAADAVRASYPAQLHFPYIFDRNKKPFFVEAIFHDDRFTYIRLSAPEVPALYEVQDGSPQLVPVEYRDGLFIVAKVLSSGYLALGKQQLPFTRTEVH